MNFNNNPMRFQVILLLSLSFFFNSLSAQKIKKIKQDLSDGSQENYSYQVNGIDTIKEGNYVRKNIPGGFIEKGFYKNGRKDSLWQTFNEKTIISSGYYTNGMRSGIWNYQTGNGKNIQQYDYTNRRVIWCDSSSFTKEEKTYKILIGLDSQEVILDFPPLYLGGAISMNYFLRNNVHYPFYEKDHGLSGIAYISFDINTDGIAENFRVVKNSSPGFDQEAMRVLMLMKENWTPAIYKGKAVRVTITQSVRFVMQ